MFIYRLISILISPFLVFYLFVRVKKGKEDQKRIGERFGISSIKRPEGEVVWLHAVSVGEVNSALILLDEILKTSPKTNILVTTTTITSAAVLAKRIDGFKGNVMHQFLPVDSYFVVKRFLKFWRPRMMIFVESEIWPNFICEAKKRGVITVLANARMSQNSFDKWKLAKKIGFNIFKNFDVIFAQTVADSQRLKKLSGKESLFFGNLKSEAVDLPFCEDKLNDIVSQITDENGVKRNVWLAASTHLGEEEKIIYAHQKLKEKFPDLLTILVPRHPHRADEIKEIMSELEVEFSQRSKGDEILKKTDIYMADTVGELGIFFRLSKIAFIGGSLSDVGGHNPFEAIKLGCVVISGRYVFNFKEIYSALEEEMGYFLVESEEDLSDVVSKLMTNDGLREDTFKSSQKVIQGYGKIAEKVVDRLF